MAIILGNKKFTRTNSGFSHKKLFLFPLHRDKTIITASWHSNCNYSDNKSE